MDQRVEKGKAGRPRAGGSEAKTERILARSWALYASGGYAAVTFDALAREEQMSKHTIYARFADKDALVRAMAEWRLDHWYSDNPLIGKSAFHDPICAFIDICLQVMLSPDAQVMSRILRGEEVSLAPLRDLIMARMHWAFARLGGIIAELPAKPAMPADMAAEAVCDMMLGHAMAQYGALPTGAALDAHLALHVPRMIAAANRMIYRPADTGLPLT